MQTFKQFLLETKNIAVARMFMPWQNVDPNTPGGGNLQDWYDIYDVIGDGNKHKAYNISSNNGSGAASGLTVKDAVLDFLQLHELGDIQSQNPVVFQDEQSYRAGTMQWGDGWNQDGSYAITHPIIPEQPMGSVENTTDITKSTRRQIRTSMRDQFKKILQHLDVDPIKVNAAVKELPDPQFATSIQATVQSDINRRGINNAPRSELGPKRAPVDPNIGNNNPF